MPVCPEVGIGLGVPRDSVRLVRRGDGVRLLGPAGVDHTAAMRRWAATVTGALRDRGLSGFVLKYTEPPVAMIVDAILGHVYGDTAERDRSTAESYELPQNLARFFAGKAASASLNEHACCSPAEPQSCCDADAKEDCCDALAEEGCGCR